MDLLFTVLKFAGAFVSGFGAIITAIPEHRRGKSSNKSPLKQFWHKLSTKQSGLYIAIIGLFVAMMSQFAETIKSSQDTKDAQSKYQKQMDVATNALAKLERESILASNSLDGIQRMITRFDRVSAAFCYELPQNNSLVATLRDYCNQCIRNRVTNSYHQPLLRQISNSSPGLDGFLSGPGGDTNLFSTDPTSLAVSINPRLSTNGASYEAMRTLGDSFFYPQYHLAFNKGHRPPEALSSAPNSSKNGSLDLHYDLELGELLPEQVAAPFPGSEPHNLPHYYVQLFYQLPSGRISVVWTNYIWPKEVWKSHGEITSIHDLDSASCYWSFSPRGKYRNMKEVNGVYQEMQLKWGLIYFDNFGVRLPSDSFKSIGSNLVEANLPSQSEILSASTLNATSANQYPLLNPIR